MKCETAASGVSTFMEAYRDIILGMRWLLAPAIIVVLSLVIANAISISVRERRTELAVLKVLGFRPMQILVLVLGEALLLGGVSGLVSAGLTYVVINKVFGGFNFPIAFFSTFLIPYQAVWWGLAVGGLASLVGSIGPALSAATSRFPRSLRKSPEHGPASGNSGSLPCRSNGSPRSCSPWRSSSSRSFSGAFRFVTTCGI